MPYITDECFASRWQYGFRRGRSAEDALCRLRHVISTSDSSHVVGILFDATAAFDYLWWPAIFDELAVRGVLLTWPNF